MIIYIHYRTTNAIQLLHLENGSKIISILSVDKKSLEKVLRKREKAILEFKTLGERKDTELNGAKNVTCFVIVEFSCASVR